MLRLVGIVELGESGCTRPGGLWCYVIASWGRMSSHSALGEDVIASYGGGCQGGGCQSVT